jgi:hypothetical protein
MTEMATRGAIEALTIDYWRRVDRLSDAPVEELYVEAGVMHLGSLRIEGKDGIRAFFIERTRQEKLVGRTTRHLVNGLWIEPAPQGRLRVSSTVQVLSGVGDWPLASVPASSVGDFEDVVAEVSPGVFRFELRSVRTVFTGAGAPAFVR